MEYRFLETTDEALVEGAGLPTGNGVVISILATGYDPIEDETVSLAILDMQGCVLFDAKVKPHNKEEWLPSEASGGIGPADVEDDLALYEREDEIMEILDGREFVVAEHVDFIEAMLDRSWIALPRLKELDVCEIFRSSHASADYPGEPATVATLESIAEYYGLEVEGPSALDRARCLLEAYHHVIREFGEKRDEKGPEYWSAWEEGRKKAANADMASERVEALRQHRYKQMNALLWVAGGIIFISLAIQLVQRGGDIGFTVVAIAAAVFAFSRAVVNWPKK